MIKINQTLKTGPLRDLPKELRQELSKVVRETAFAIERDAKLVCPVDTGALRASIYTVTQTLDGREAALAQADSLYWKGKDVDNKGAGLPVANEPPKPTSELQAYVAVGMRYGIHVEYGTGRMAPRLFMTQATEMNRKPFADAVDKAFKEAGYKSGWK